MHVLHVVGARPQFVKLAPVSAAVRRHGHRERILHTGQHFDDAMSRVFFRELGIGEPHVDLGVHSLTHGAMTGRMLEGIERVLLDDRPDVVLVYGDTDSTLAAVKLGVPHKRSRRARILRARRGGEENERSSRGDQRQSCRQEGRVGVCATPPATGREMLN